MGEIRMWMDYSTFTIPSGGTLNAAGYYRYLVVLRGNGRFTAEGVSVDISLHSFFTVPQDTTGRLESDSGTSFQLGCVEIRAFRSTSQRVTVLSPEDTEFARRIFYLGLDMQDCALPYYDTVNAALHQLMFSALLAAGLSSQTMNSQVFQVIEDVNEHFTDPSYDIRKAIEQTGYTPNHFRKIFRDEIGVTPSEFVTARRLDRSEELLTQFRNRIPIKDIALQCGFQDPYYFSRLFKKRRGISPQAYVDGLTGEVS